MEFYDRRAQRELAAARADRIRARVERERLAMQAERDRLEAERRRARVEARAARRTARRAALAGAAAAVRARVPALVGAVAIGAPMIIAWRGQAGFAAEVMGLDWPILVPVAIEGSVLYTAYLAHRAVSLSLPAARYRAMTWALAAVAAGMNLWHYLGDGPQVAVVYAACSLLSILLWELTVGLRGRVRSGRSGAEIRAAAWRRIRYPRLSWQAASIRAARGPACSPDEAWRAAWVDRYGVGPDAPLRERRLASRIVRATARAEMRAARRGELAMVGGVILGRPLPPVVTHGVTAASEPGERSVTYPAKAADAVSSPPVPARALEAVPESADSVTEPVTEPVTEARSRRAVAAARPRRRTEVRATVSARRTVEEHRGELARLIAAGELPADASVRQIRRALGCAQGTAVALAAELAGGAA